MASETVCSAVAPAWSQSLYTKPSSFYLDFRVSTLRHDENWPGVEPNRQEEEQRVMRSAEMHPVVGCQRVVELSQRSLLILPLGATTLWAGPGLGRGVAAVAHTGEEVTG
jgi:hypothetical protein